jgi:hypothetical protein
VAIGDSALLHNGEGVTYSDEACENTAIGSKALYSNMIGSYNVANGFQALYSNTSGYGNTATGDQALYSNTYGYNNTAIGCCAFGTGNYNNSTALGHDAPITASGMVRLGDNYVSWIGGHSAWHNTSDGRFKRNIKEDIPGLDFIVKLRPVSYTWDIKALDKFVGLPDSISDQSADERVKAEQIVHTGFIAQEVEQVAQESGFDFDGVHHPANENDPYSLAYAEFVVPLVKAVQEQQAMIEELKVEMQALKAQLKK